MSKFRIPRKQKKKIPKGILYCYTPIKYDIEKGIYHVKPCPFYGYKHDEEFDYMMGWCKLVKTEVEDQCKSCGSRYPKW